MKFLAALLLIASASFAAADTKMFLKFEDTSVKGQVVTSGYEDSIEVLSFNYSVETEITFGGSTSGTTTKPFVSPLQFTAAFDGKAYSGLLKKSLLPGSGGTTSKIATFTSAVINGAGGTSFAPLKIEIYGVITSLSTTQSGGDSGAGFMEIRFTPAKIVVTPSYLNAQGVVTAGAALIYDVVANTVN